MGQILYQPQYRVTGTTTWLNWGTSGSGTTYGGPGEIAGTSITIGSNPPGPALISGTSYDFQILTDNGYGTTASSIVTTITLASESIEGFTVNVLGSSTVIYASQAMGVADPNGPWNQFTLSATGSVILNGVSYNSGIIALVYHNHTLFQENSSLQYAYWNTTTTTWTNYSVSSINLSNSSFIGSAASGTTVGTISVSMTDGSTFSGTLTLGGANAANFQIVGNKLETLGVNITGSYSITITATPTVVGTLLTSGTLSITASQPNMISNSTNTGSVIGTPGTLPTGWAILSNGGGTGLISVINYGTDSSTGSALPFIDIQFSGAPTGSMAISFGNVAVSAANIYTLSYGLAIESGNTTNIASINVIWNELTSAGASNNANPSSLAALNSILTIFNVSSTTVTGTAFIQPTLTLATGTGIVNITIRIAGVELNVGNTRNLPFSGTPVGTTSINSIGLSNLVVPTGSPINTVVGTINVLMNIGTFSGSLSIGFGTVTGESAPGATATPGTGSIVCGNTPGAPGIGNTWTISSAGVIALNGTPNTGTSGVTEIYYINHAVYQFNGTSWYGPMTSTSTGALPLAASPAVTNANLFALSGGNTLVTNDASLPANTYVVSVTATQAGLTALTQNFTITVGIVSSGTGPTVTSGTLMNADFTSFTGQTVPNTIWGYATANLINSKFSICSNTTFQAAAQILNVPHLRLNGQSGVSNYQGFIGGGVFVNGINSPDWSYVNPFIQYAYTFLPATCKTSIGFVINSPAGGNWSLADFQSMVTQTINYFAATNGGNGVPVNIWGVELHNEPDNSPNNQTAATVASYFQSMVAGVAASSKPITVTIGPATSYANAPYITGIANATSNLGVVSYHCYMSLGVAMTDQQWMNLNNTLPGGTSAYAGNTSSARSALVASTNANKNTIPLGLTEWNFDGNVVASIEGNDQTNIGAVFAANALITSLNADNLLTYGGLWDLYYDGLYGVITSSNTITPMGYMFGISALKAYGTRVSCPVLNSGTNYILALAMTGGNGATSICIMMTNYHVSNAYSGTIGFSHWPVNTTGTASINQWQLTSTNTAGAMTSLPVTAGIVTVSLPAASVTLLYYP